MKLGHISTNQINQQSKEWRHTGFPKPKKFRVQISAGRDLALVFWVYQGTAVIDFLDKDITITGNYYSKLLTTLREN